MQSKSGESRAWDVLSHRFTEMPAAMTESLPELSTVEKEMIDMWTQDAVAATLKKRGKKNVDIGYDLAVSLLMMDAPEAALAVATSIPSNSKNAVGVDWLIAELLLSLRRFVDLLNHLQHLEVTYSNDPETAFAVSYLRAHALKALGQSAAAVEILRNIVQVRPNYRSAGHLAIEWGVGVAIG